MAIGAVVSHRNFGSFIDSGRVRRGESATTNQRGEPLGVSAVQCVNRKFFCNKLYLPRGLCGYTYYSSLHTSGRSNSKCLRSKSPSHVEAFLSVSQLLNENFIFINRRQRMRGICQCSLFEACFNDNSIHPRKLDNLGFIDRHVLSSKHTIVTRTRADFKSEEHDITGTELESVGSSEMASEAALHEGNEQSQPWWKQFPKRWVIVMLCFASFLLCNMDRVNMSIAILPMSKEFNWNSATVGLIQSSFFWGYLLTQIVGGIWADKFGGKLVLGFGVVWWSIATVLTPIAARIGLPFLLVMRAFMGIGEGVAMPAMNNMLSKWIPVSERSRSLALVYSGMYLGSVTGLAVSPVLIHKFGWSSVFYAFGSLGSIWFALWLKNAHSSPEEDPKLSAEEKKLILGGSIRKEPVSEIPWKIILSKAPVWALIITHFCHNWGTFILLTWMPTYYNQVLKFNLTESGLLCVLPWFTMAVFANIGGWIADTLVSKGLSITSVRKASISIDRLGPAFFLTQLKHVKTPALAVLCMACSQGSDAFSQSGLYSNHQDIGPRYAGVLLGLSNTAGVLAGVFGTAATGYILQKGSWDDVFKVAVVLYIIGTLVWNFFSTGEKILD
ncbi:ascorbate transporter, chloroplastic isoform X1 [Olea europaea var. sylvestris]|uniref:ascorbate transporter, chloroplastic isoform X1 n=1 Tax=Olea europaea var. sylvestris TaxID=158386 RepID=UPI000C1D5109|nr:ascorbate transporter, chloroplastic isoform X1 [Olea europaea var. sylvestris]